MKIKIKIFLLILILKIICGYQSLFTQETVFLEEYSKAVLQGNVKKRRELIKQNPKEAVATMEFILDYIGMSVYNYSIYIFSDEIFNLEEMLKGTFKIAEYLSEDINSVLKIPDYKEKVVNYKLWIKKIDKEDKYFKVKLLYNDGESLYKAER
ncbi:MAG: hypothetical protein NZ839_01125, partial [Endomicrobia bacterium]|nr:hypothetical protein [Endomicrobiia bacterium]